MSYTMMVIAAQNDKEKLRVCGKRVILLNCTHRDRLWGDVEAERLRYGCLGIDGGCA